MQPLMAGIEGELTISIWNAVDRSNPKMKWRRTVPERAPHRIGMVRHGSIMTVRRPKVTSRVATESNLGTYGNWLAPGDLTRVGGTLPASACRGKHPLCAITRRCRVREKG